MSKLLGIFKIALVLALDFSVIYSLLHDLFAASITAGVITLYVLFGGYIALFKEGAVSVRKLPTYQRNRLEAAKQQLTAEVRASSGANISGIKLYLVPGDDEMNAAAYGCNCISVTRGAFDRADAVTLKGILAHEISHIRNSDAEFNRAVFCSVTLLIAAMSVMSFSVIAVIFIAFLILSFFGCFRSWLGLILFRGTTKVVGGIFGMLQRGIIVIYRLLLSLASRHAEYRADKYACTLGYGLQLAHFLSLTQPGDRRPLTLTEAMYRSHPPVEKRIARLERQMTAQSTAGIADRRSVPKPF